MKTAMDNIQQRQGNKGEIAFEKGLKIPLILVFWRSTEGYSTKVVP